MTDETDTDLAQFDLSLKKKKKKKKTEEDLKETDDTIFNLTIEENEKDEDEFSYTYLLDRIYRSLRENHPSLVSRKKIIIPAPIVLYVGSKKTMWSNFTATLQAIHRQPEHLQAYVISELNSTCSVDSNVRLIIKGRFNAKHIQSILQKYITNYVSCHMCLGHDTSLVRDAITRLYFLHCDSCKSSRSVQPIKNGYHH
jgi:translation initiation factor 2 subunit 2